MVLDLTKPQEGATNWGSAVNQNFTDLESDLNRRDPSRSYSDYTDWVSATTAGESNWLVSVSGTGASGSLLAAVAPNHPGQLQLSTGTTTTGRAGLVKANPNTVLRIRPATRTVFEVCLRVPILSTSVQRFAVRVGFGNRVPSVSGGRPTNGTWFELDPQTIGSSNWHLLSATLPVTGVEDLGIAPAADTFTRLRFETDASNAMRVWIDDTEVAAASIPTTGDVGPLLVIEKAAGTTARTLVIDYCRMEIQFTEPR